MNVHDFLKIVDGQVIYRNGKVIGDIVQDVDGYHLFFPLGGQGGGYTASLLDMISQLLAEIDHDWDAQIKRFFEEEGIDDE